jgi:hypothetical protein
MPHGHCAGNGVPKPLSLRSGCPFDIRVPTISDSGCPQPSYSHSLERSMLSLQSKKQLLAPKCLLLQCEKSYQVTSNYVLLYEVVPHVESSRVLWTKRIRTFETTNTLTKMLLQKCISSTDKPSKNHSLSLHHMGVFSSQQILTLQNLKKALKGSGVLAHPCNPTTQEVE